MNAAYDKKIRAMLSPIIGDAGNILHVEGSFDVDSDLNYWTVYVDSELAALRVYHAHGGSGVFGNNRVKETKPGWFRLTTFKG